jgi:hypothetical protein
MKGKILAKWFGLFLAMLFLLPFSADAAMEGKSLLGEETPLFTLPSTHDRAITYANEYYGKHHLIMTFFPAAFTPV